MDDKLIIENLHVTCIIGDREEERVTPQELIVDAVLQLVDIRATATDVIEDTVDYTVIIDSIRETLIRHKCYMIEHAAQCVVNACFSEDKRIRAARVTIRKPQAVDKSCVGFCVTRKRID